ncbi:MAG: hypothetical protein JW940_13685 [Polyangiaceae bacterium]|nr:hypothetical protein [Polyangiaceae bacterium]
MRQRLKLVPKELRAIRDHSETLGGKPGSEVSDLESVAGGHRVKYQDGTIYRSPDGALGWVHGAIDSHYDDTGGPSSWLGFPVADEEDMTEGGRASRFEHGEIYWWPDVGAIDLNEVIVHYTGLICFGETDWDQGSDSDEPYVLLGVVSPEVVTLTTGTPGVGAAAAPMARSKIYEDVDAGEGRPDVLELYRGKPMGLSVICVLMEHDEGDPDKYKDEVGQAVEYGSDGLEIAVAYIPVVGPPLAKAAGPLLKKYAPEITDFFNQLLDTDDDALGTESVFISAKQMVLLATKTENSASHGVGYKLETPLFSSDGATYKVYFGLVPA